MSTLELLRVTVRFVYRNVYAILRIIVVPTLIFVAVVGLGIDLYLDVLNVFLAEPTERAASLVLAVPVGAIILLTFLNAWVGQCLTELVFRLGVFKRGGGDSQPIPHSAWRLFAAYLRCWLIICAALCVAALFHSSFAWLSIGSGWYAPSAALTTVLLYVLALRLSMFAAPFALWESGPIVRRCWKLSGIYLKYVLGLGLAVAFVAIALEFSCETFFDFLIRPINPPSAATLAGKAAYLRLMLPVWLPSFSIAYVFAAMFFFTGSAIMFQVIEKPKHRS
jgi:hypothetical protein